MAASRPPGSTGHTNPFAFAFVSFAGQNRVTPGFLPLIAWFAQRDCFCPLAKGGSKKMTSNLLLACLALSVATCTMAYTPSFFSRSAGVRRGGALTALSMKHRTDSMAPRIILYDERGGCNRSAFSFFMSGQMFCRTSREIGFSWRFKIS